MTADARASADGLDLTKAPILAHLLELRRRLLISMACFAAAFAGGYAFSEPLYGFLTRPLAQALGDESGRRMIYTALHEAFLTYLKLAFFAATFVSLPVMLNQLWGFLSPGLYERERRSLRPLLVATPVLFLVGAALAFYVVFPLAWRFFLSFESPGAAGALPIELEARVSEYLSLVMRLTLAFGLGFELPVVMLALARLGLVTADTLRAHRKHAIVLIFGVAALLTPPDLISQIALGTPVLLLYELSIHLVRWSDADVEGRRRASLQS